MSEEEQYEELSGGEQSLRSDDDNDEYDISAARKQAAREAAGLAEGEEYGENDENPDEEYETEGESEGEWESADDNPDEEDPFREDEPALEGEEPQEETSSRREKAISHGPQSIAEEEREEREGEFKSGEKYTYDYTRIIYETHPEVPEGEGVGFEPVIHAPSKMFLPYDPEQPSYFKERKEYPSKETPKGISLDDSFTHKDISDPSSFAHSFVNFARSYVEEILSSHSIKNDGLENMGICKVKGKIHEAPGGSFTIDTLPMTWKLEDTDVVEDNGNLSVIWSFQGKVYKYQVPSTYIVMKGYYDKELDRFRHSLAVSFANKKVSKKHRSQHITKYLDQLSEDFGEDLFASSSVGQLLSSVYASSTTTHSPLGSYLSKIANLAISEGVMDSLRRTDEEAVAVFLDTLVSRFVSEMNAHSDVFTRESEVVKYLASKSNLSRDKRQFDKEYLKRVKGMYGEYIEPYPREYSLVSSKKQSTQSIPIPEAKKYTYRSFLETALRPLLFIEDISESIFFFAQLRSGYMRYSYFLDNEVSNVAYYFPELAISYMKDTISQEEFEECLTHILALLSLKVRKVFKIIKEKINGSSVIESMTNEPKTDDYWPWERYVTPIYKLCGMLISNKSRSNLIDIYTDIALHYDESTRTFNCFKITAILRAVIRSECEVCSLFYDDLDKYPKSLVKSLRKNRKGCLEEMRKVHHHDKATIGRLSTVDDLLSIKGDVMSVFFIQGVEEVDTLKKYASNIQANEQLRGRIRFFYTFFADELNTTLLKAKAYSIVFVRKRADGSTIVGVQRDPIFLTNLRAVRDTVEDMMDDSKKVPKVKTRTRTIRTFSPQFEEEAMKMENELEDLEKLSRKKGIDPSSLKSISDKIHNLKWNLDNLALTSETIEEAILEEPEEVEYKTDLSSTKVTEKFRNTTGKDVKPIGVISAERRRKLIDYLKVAFDEPPPPKKLETFINPLQRVTFKILRSEKGKEAYLKELDSIISKKREEFKKTDVYLEKVSLKQQAEYTNRLKFLIKHQPVFDDKATIEDKNTYLEYLKKSYKELKTEAGDLKKNKSDDPKTKPMIAVISKLLSAIGNTMYQVRVMKVMPELESELHYLDDKIANAGEDAAFRKAMMDQRRYVENQMTRLRSGTVEERVPLEEDRSYVHFFVPAKDDIKRLSGKINTFLPTSAVITAYSSEKLYGKYPSKGRYNVPYQNIDLAGLDFEDEEVVQIESEEEDLDEQLGLAGTSVEVPQIFEDMAFFFEDGYTDETRNAILRHGGMVVEEFDPFVVTHLVTLSKRSELVEEAKENGLRVVKPIDVKNSIELMIPFAPEKRW